MFCSKCGAKLDKNAQFCSECGNSLSEQTSAVQKANSEIEEGSTFGWGVLGFFIPLAGLILFIMWKTEKPKSSKSAGIGALISVISQVVLYIILFILMFALGFSEASNSIYY